MLKLCNGQCRKTYEASELIKGRCKACRRVKEANRGTTVQRGYDAQYVIARRTLATFVGTVCSYPNCYETKTDCHHIVSLSKGGTNTVDNLRFLCKKHHKQIHQEQDNKDAAQ